MPAASAEHPAKFREHKEFDEYTAAKLPPRSLAHTG